MRYFAMSLAFTLGISLGYFGPGLEDRVRTLEVDMAACCGTQYGLSEDEEKRFEAYVALKKRVQTLERELEELRAVMGLRK